MEPTTTGDDDGNAEATTTADLQVDELSSGLAAQVLQLGVSESSATATAADAASPDKKKEYRRWSLLDEVDYGYLAQTRGAGIEAVASSSEDGISSSSNSSFYITTAINYTNGPAHIGHAYEAATSDVLARFHRLLGDEPCYFVTGADEHGQKIANTAADMNQRPIEICDKYVTGFKVLNQRILVSNDDYVRTTSERHKRTAKELWKRCHAAGDIYLDTYQGWYNVKEETFVTDSEAAMLEYKCPNSGQPLKRVEEESYFFKMSRYENRLIEHIKENPEFIMPEAHRNQILARLQSDGLRDLSISRTTFDWGIPVPDGFDDKHVMYVWLDALSNYLTGVNGLGVNDDGSPEGLEKFWPASVHVIGKDILWFHTVIWPCLLMSAGVPLARTVFAHGFVNDKEGKKMSKSLGNVVDPHDMLDKYDVDMFRWYLCKEAPYGGELSFSEESMRDMHNADLCDTLGNLVHRATNLCGKFCDGAVPDVPPPDKSPVDLADVVASYADKMNKFELQGGANVAIQGFRDVNGYLQEEAPWAKKGDENKEARQIIVRASLEAIYALAHLLLPFLPHGACKIFKKLNTEPVALKDLDLSCRNLKAGTKIEVGDVLYSKAMSEDEIRDAQQSKPSKKETHAEAQRRKKEARAAQVAKSNKGKQEAGNTNQPDFTKMDIRVGKIVKVWNHPEAGRLYCEHIDVGEESGGIREVASGLRNFYALEDMQDKKVLVICNLKSVKLAGFDSCGMVLAAKSDDGTKVELVTPPDGAAIGERVFIQGLTGDPVTSTQVRKKKVWEAVLEKKLVTDDSGVATWDGKPIESSAGPCKVASLTGAPIS